MKKKRRILLLCLMLVLALCVLGSPKQRARLFVTLHGNRIEAAMAAGNGVPANIGYKAVNSWPGEHTMTEFLLGSRGFGSQSRYYGCYYSPDDVPLAFQNASVPLTQDGHDYWLWQGEGDNHGTTQRLRKNWFYFEAYF